MASTAEATEGVPGNNSGKDERCLQGCVEIGLVDYGKTTYLLLHDPATNRWFLAYKEEKKGKEITKEITVYVGNLEVQRIRDPVLGPVIVIKSDNATVYGPNVETVIREFIANEPKAKNKPFLEPSLRTLIETAEVRDGHVIGGFYPDGFFEGLEPYPVVDWGCRRRPKSLEEVINYITKNYPVGNRVFALVNVALAIAKVFSPAVRLARKTFEDRVVINTGVMRIGKTKLFQSIINLLGLDYDRVYVDGDLTVKTPERIRNLLMESNAPLFIDDVGAEGFEALSNIVLSIISGGIVGLQANKVGLGFASKFRVLRSMMVNTNVTEGRIRSILSQDEVTAWVRRAMVLPWAEAPLPKGVSEWEGEPIIGCLRELWDMRQVREGLIGVAHDIVGLAKYVVDALRRQYGVEVKPLLEALRLVEEVSREAEEDVVRRHRPEELIGDRAFAIARQVLGIPNVSVYQVVKAMVGAPREFDIKLTKPKNPERELEEWRRLVVELGFNPENLSMSPEAIEESNLTDVEKALAYVWWLMEEKGLGRVIIYANSEHGLLQGSPRQLFGSPRGEYDGRRGYSVSWADILRSLISISTHQPQPQATSVSQGQAVENVEAAEKP